MDYTKVQSQVMTDKIAAVNGVSKFLYGACEYDQESYHGITEGHYIVFVPEWAYYIDDNKVFGNKPAWEGVKGIVQTISDTKPIKLTPDLKTVEGHKKPLLVFENEEEEKIYIDSALHDNFKTAPSITYRGTTSKAPIFLFSYDRLIGCILPVMIKGA